MFSYKKINWEKPSLYKRCKLGKTFLISLIGGLEAGKTSQVIRLFYGIN